MSEDKNMLNEEQPDKLIANFLAILQQIRKEKKLFFKYCGIAAVIGIVVALSIPKEYTTIVKFAPESSSKSGIGSIGALAAMAGINLGGLEGGQDALSPGLYPDIVSSTPFLVSLFDLQVVSMDGEINTTLYDYLNKHQKKAWWGHIFGFPHTLLNWISPKKEKEEENKPYDLFMLTPQEKAIAAKLNKLILIEKEAKSGMTVIEVTMQDALISAALTDTITNRLQKHIIDYRTNKARYDLNFTEKLYAEAKDNYYNAQQKYAKAMDGNLDIVKLSYKAELERLQNEMSLTYNVFTQVAQQLQMSKAKVQEITPVYTIVEPAIVPLDPSKPKRKMIVIGFVFLAVMGCLGWIFFLRDLLKGQHFNKIEKE